MGLHFDISATDSNFTQVIDKTMQSVTNAMKLISEITDETKGYEDQIARLTDRIRSCDDGIRVGAKSMHTLGEELEQAFNSGDTKSVEEISAKISNAAARMQSLTEKSNEAKEALAVIGEMSGDASAKQATVTAPKLFTDESDYLKAQQLSAAIEKLKTDIASFSGSEDGLYAMQDALNDMESKLTSLDSKAAEAASRLGSDLGTKASEAATNLYELNKAIVTQESTVGSLKTAVQDATEQLAALKSAGAERDEIMNAQTQLDAVTQSLKNANNELLNLKAAQEDAKTEMGRVNAEINQHDSIMVKMLGGYDKYTTIISNLPGPIQGVIGSVNGMTGAAKAFLATSIGITLGAIIIALQTLKTWFDETSEGQMAFAKASGYVTGILDKLKMVIAKVGKKVYEVGKIIYKAFKDPQKAVEGLWDVIMTNLVNRFKALSLLASHVGEALEAAFTPGKSVSDAIKNIGDDIAMLVTGVENATDKIGKAYDKANNFMSSVHENGLNKAKIEEEKLSLDREVHEWGKRKAELDKIKAEAQAKIYNTSLSSKERDKAMKEFEAAIDEQYKKEEEIALKRIRIQNTDMGLSNTSLSDENMLADLEAAKLQLEARKAHEIASLQRRKNSISNSENSEANQSAKILSKEQNITDLLRKQGIERLRIQQDYEYERWQSRIDLMEDGEAKVLAQMELDNKKEITALERNKEQEIEAEISRQKALFDAQEEAKSAKNKKYSKKVFNTNLKDESNADIDRTRIDTIEARYNQLYADLAAKQAKAEQDRLKAANEAMNAYLQEFGNYQQKRLAIQEEYEKKITKAQNEGERMTLIAQRDKSLADLDYSEWVDTGAIALAFGDISKLSDSTVDKLIDDMERYREKVIATFDPDKIKEYEQALTALHDRQADKSFGLLSGAIPEYFVQRKSVASQKDSALANVRSLDSQRAALQSRKIALESQQANGNDVSKELSEVNSQLQANENATKKAKNAFKQLQEQWDSLNSPEDKFYGICEAVAQAAGMVGTLSNQFAAMADAMGTGGLSSAASTVGEAMSSVQNVASGFANGGLVGGIAAAAGEVMGWATKLFSAGDAKHEKKIKKLQEQIDALNKSYEKLNNSVEDAYSTDASGLIEQQNTLLKQQKILIQQQMAEEEAKKKTDSEKIKNYKEQLEEIDEILEDNKKKAKEAIIGTDIKSAIGEFADAYASAWEDGTDAASKSMSAVKSIVTSALNELLKKRLQPTVDSFYDSLAKAMSAGILTETELTNLDALKSQMDSIVLAEEEQYKKILDRYKDLDELKEELTDISFDSVRDNFKSQLLDMEADASDFTESFTDMLRSAVIEGLMDNKYDAMLKEWYDEFAKAMDNQTLTDEERDSLRQKYESIINQGLADRDALNEIIGSSAYSQEASKGSWESMGQDQAEELSGRFTALTELQVISNDLQLTQNSIAADILATLQGMSILTPSAGGADPTLLAIKDMVFLSTGYLEDIAKYTKMLNSVDARLAALNNMIDRKL